MVKMDIGFKIKELRIARAFSLQQLADLSGLSKPAIQQYEDGTINPSNKALQGIAQALGVGVWSFFNLNKNRLELAEFRFGHTLEDMEEEKRAVYNEIVVYCQNYIELETILGERIPFENPISDIKIESYEDVEKAVKRLRKKWKLNDNPIDDISGFLEGKGVKIVKVTRDTQSPGLCGYIQEGDFLIPFIIINIFEEHVREVTRKRFTILHELAHLLLVFADGVSKDFQEKLCNKFASAFLLPENVLVEYLGRDRTTISLEELKSIKQIYGISIQGIIYGANAVGLISDSTRRDWLVLYENWRAAGDNFGTYSKSEEEPGRFNRLLTRALVEKRISKEKVADLLDIKLDEVEKRFGNKILNIGK